MEMKLENGSTIKTIESGEAIRGHKANHIEYYDPVISDEDIDKVIKPFMKDSLKENKDNALVYISSARNNICDFVENIMNIKLLSYQKKLLEFFSRHPNVDFSGRKSCRSLEYKWRNYIYMCEKYYKMSDDDTIAVLSPGGVNKMNKEEFGEYIDEYWRE